MDLNNLDSFKNNSEKKTGYIRNPKSAHIKNYPKPGGTIGHRLTTILQVG